MCTCSHSILFLFFLCSFCHTHVGAAEYRGHLCKTYYRSDKPFCESCDRPVILDQHGRFFPGAFVCINAYCPDAPKEPATSPVTDIGTNIRSNGGGTTTPPPVSPLLHCSPGTLGDLREFGFDTNEVAVRPTADTSVSPPG